MGREVGKGTETEGGERGREGERREGKREKRGRDRVIEERRERERGREREREGARNKIKMRNETLLPPPPRFRCTSLYRVAHIPSFCTRSC